MTNRPSKRRLLIFLGICLAIPIALSFFPDASRPGTNLGGEFSGGLLGVTVLLLLYFAPALVAAHRRHNNQLAITVLNLFLGWTILGWIAALVWASTSDAERTVRA